MEKIFLIGRRRTGIGSIAKGLRTLGFNSNTMVLTVKEEGIEGVIKAMEKKKVCGVPFDYTMNDIRAIEAAYPSCRFILTERNTDEWYSSFLRFYSEDESRRAYKNKGHYVNDFYIKYNESIRSHFAGKEWKILYVKYGVNSNWGSLCSFVSKPIPNKPFPHENILKK